MEESLRKVKTLGQVDEDVDDLAKWVTKSRTREEEDKELAREEALAAEPRQAEQVCSLAAAKSLTPSVVYMFFRLHLEKSWWETCLSIYLLTLYLTFLFFYSHTGTALCAPFIMQSS